MAAKNGDNDFGDNLYAEDGVYGDKTLTYGNGVAYAWPIIRNLLSKCAFTSLHVCTVRFYMRIVQYVL